MTPQILGGFFLMALGAVILFGGFDSAVPLRVGGAALVSGVVLVLVGARRRTRFHAA
jgi:hypothetical protein